MKIQKSNHLAACRAIRSYSSPAGQPAIPYQRGAGYPLLSRADGTYTYFCTLFILFLLTISSCTFAQKELSFTDKSFEPQIKTIRLYPNHGGPRDYLQSPAAPIQQQNLLLEFDDLQDNRDNYYVKLIHCNFDWTKSTLSDLDFLESYNENSITDYNISINTHTRYMHYRYPVPPVKIPGNYLLIVYRDDKSDLILSKRMMIYHNQISLTKDNLFSGSGTLRLGKQQFNFDINYSDIEILNPMQSVHVTIRQNQRWDNCKADLPPNFIRENQSQLEYRFLDDANQFDGGNEFRFVDFRSLNSPGQNTGKLNRGVKPYELYVALDNDRSYQSYAQYFDFNGNYLVENLDVGDAPLTGNYVYVNFILKSPPIPNADVYVVGAFNNYQCNEENKMTQNTEGYYESRQFLKQGLYNYQYYVDSPKHEPNYIEGNHFETENVYEVLIYNRPFRPNADLLLGYYLIPVNQR
jgi:Domain of unknown function (DUF5103)